MSDKSREDFQLQLEGLLESLVFWGLVKIRQRLWPRLARVRDKLWSARDPAVEVVRLIQQVVDCRPHLRRFWVSEFSLIPSYAERVVSFTSAILANQQEEGRLVTLKSLSENVRNTGIVLMPENIAALIAIDLADRYPETRDRGVRTK